MPTNDEDTILEAEFTTEAPTVDREADDSEVADTDQVADTEEVETDNQNNGVVLRGTLSPAEPKDSNDRMSIAKTVLTVMVVVALVVLAALYLYGMQLSA